MNDALDLDCMDQYLIRMVDRIALPAFDPRHARPRLRWIQAGPWLRRAVVVALGGAAV